MKHTVEQLEAELENFCQKTFGQYAGNNWGQLSFSISLNSDHDDESRDFEVMLTNGTNAEHRHLIFRVNDDVQLDRGSIQMLFGEEFEDFSVSRMWAYLFLSDFVTTPE